MDQEKPAQFSPKSILDRSVDLIFRAAYAPVDVADLLESAEARSRIRRLAPPQLFFGLTRLSDRQMQVLLPQITEQQWRAVLDLSLWDGGVADCDRFLEWQRHMVDAEPAVARKLWRATSPHLWELAFTRDLKVARRNDEDSFEGELDPDADLLATPDNAYLIQLPSDPEKARIWSSLLPRLFALEPEAMGLILEDALYRTPSEIEEEAYRERCHRLEDLGFQDYFEAISIYSPLESERDLPEKNPESGPVTTLPEAPNTAPPGLLLVQALGLIADKQLLEQTLQEIFFVCNKLLSADRVSPEEPDQIRETIRKVLAGINLGLSLTTGDSLPQALEALRRYFLAGLFQLSYARLLVLRDRAGRLLAAGMREDLFEQAFLESLSDRYPRPVSLKEGQIRSGYFWTREELETAHRQLDRMA